MMIPGGEAALTQMQIPFDTYIPRSVFMWSPDFILGGQRENSLYVSCVDGKLAQGDRQKPGMHVKKRIM